MALENYDFSGWATKNDILCSDGRTIRQNAFKDNDGQIVPLVYGHSHDDPMNVLGHALLVNKPEGVRAYGKFNDTEAGQHMKQSVANGDITHLSIYANKLKQKGGDVIHGDIKEVSLVMAGANVGALIDVPFIEHEDNEDFSAVIYFDREGVDEPITLVHSEDDTEETFEEEEVEEDLEHADDKKEEKPEEKSEDKPDEDGKSFKEIIDTMNEEQKMVFYTTVGNLLDEQAKSENVKEDKKEDDEEDEEEVKHSEEGDENTMAYNVFDEESRNANVLTHDDMVNIVELAKKPQVGSFQTALEYYAEENDKVLQHEDPAWFPPKQVGGFIQQPVQTGDLTVEALFPEYKDIGQPWNNIITNDQSWIAPVLSKTHKSPISRVRTGQVDIRNIEALRARGYQKGNYKKETGNFKLVRRTTDPQTIYVKNALHRDDIVDITDFDYVQYLYNIDRMMLNEELATAVLFGDGRDDADEAKIFPEHIRPIWLDDELYTRHFDLDMEAARESIQGTETDSYFSENYIRAEAFVEKCLYTREEHKGTGTPDMFIHPHELNVMLLSRDRNGRRIYNNVNDLKAALNVANIYTCEQMLGKVRKDDQNVKHKLLALIVNLADYQIGSTKGGELTHFTQFDIDFNQEKSLLETRLSGALTKVYSAIAIEEVVTGN